MSLTKSLLLLTLMVVAASATIDLESALLKMWDQYTIKYSKSYDSFEAEYKAQKNFFHNLDRIHHLRLSHEAQFSEKADHIYGINKFSDVHPDEFKARYLNYKPNRKGMKQYNIHPIAREVEVPTKFDWFTEGACTPVKDQGQCGSCWAFSATEEIESMYIRQFGQTYVLAPQQIVSCDDQDGGCAGGEPVTAYEYVQGAGGLVQESDDPYTSGQTGDNGNCSIDASDEVVTLTNYSFAIPPCEDSCTNQDESLLQQQLYAVGPVSICVDAESWQYYTGGVLKANCPSDYNDIDHCVQLTGYDSTTSPGYWIVRNSWNTDWGQDGFIWVQMGSNLCGIADSPTFVQTAAANQN